MSPGPHQPERQAEELAGALDRMAAAIDQARAVGLYVDVPDVLYSACLKIVARYGTPSDPIDLSAKPKESALNPASGSSTTSKSVGASPADVPLRRLVWQVLDPGEEFTVTDVVARLALLEVSLHPNKVSNALGYWVSRGRLARKSKGVYLYPVIADSNVKPGKSSIGHEAVAGQSARRRRKDEDNDGQNAERQAM